MNRKEFVQQLQDALSHLYSFGELAAHPLVPLLLRGVERRSNGGALSALLSQALESCKPSDTVPASSPRWREYRYLSLRYLLCLPVAQVARELNVSERQSQRIQSEALETLGEMLWPRAQEMQTGGVASPRVVLNDGPTSTAEEPSVASEAARLSLLSRQQTADLADVVQGVIETAEKLTQARKIALSMHLPMDLPAVAVERTLLRQAMLCLLVAAIETGASQIEISGTPVSGAAELRISIAALNAPGRSPIAPERSATSKDLLARISQSRSLEAGIRMLEMQDGNAQVVKEPWGLAIRTTIPLARPTTVLVIDDNPDTLRLYRRYLSGGSYQILEASSGERGFELARQMRPSTIVLDVMMPNQDGWETLQRLHNDLDTGKIPVIICSVLSQRDLALSLGAVATLAKPITRQLFLETLQACMAPVPPG